MTQSYPRPAGDAEHPYSGRIWLRKFASGQVELLYKSHGQGPGEAEQINAWMADAGIENKLAPGALKRGFGCGDQAKPDSGQAEGLVGETNGERASRRAKQQVRWKTKALGADRLLTLTTRENITDFAASRKAFMKFTAACRREWPTFKFVAVPEKQERGAWHWHLAVKGWQNVHKLRAFWWRALGRKVAFSEEGKPVLLNASETPGNIDVTNPGRRGSKRKGVWAVDRLSCYLAKYIGKTFEGERPEEVKGRASYAASRGLDHDVERYCVRALTYTDVSGAVFDVLARAGAVGAWLWQSPDRRVIWAAASSVLGPGSP